MHKRILLLGLGLLWALQSHAQQTPPSGSICTNQECTIPAAEVAQAAGLLGLTVVPYLLGFDQGRRHFLGSPWELVVGVGPSSARLFRVLMDQNQFPETNWGLFTEFEAVAPRTDKITEVRFQAGAQYTLVRLERIRFGISSGLVFSKILEQKESFGGAVLGSNFFWDLREKWKLNFQLNRLFQKQDSTRAGIHLHYTGWDCFFGYEFEDSRLKNTHLNFVSFGFAGTWN